jgi:hypothetical protein
MRVLRGFKKSQSPRRSSGAAAAAPPRRRHPQLPPGSGGIQEPGCGQPARSAAPGGPAEGAEQRRWVLGAEAGPRDRPGAPRTTEGGWGRAGRLASGFCSAPPTQRQAAPYAAARLAGRARGRGGRQNASNLTAHPTSPCSPQSARGGGATSATVRLRCDAMSGSRHTRPRGSQGEHAGPRGGKMRAILRRIQRAYFRRHLRTGSRATPVAVRLEHA